MTAAEDGGINRSVAQIFNRITSVLHSFSGSINAGHGLSPHYRTLAPEVWGDALGIVLTLPSGSGCNSMETMFAGFSFDGLTWKNKLPQSPAASIATTLSPLSGRKPSTMSETTSSVAAAESEVQGKPPVPQHLTSDLDDRILNEDVPSSEDELPVRQAPKAKAKSRSNKRAPPAPAEGGNAGTSDVAVPPRGSKRSAPAQEGEPNTSTEAESDGVVDPSRQELPSPGQDGGEGEANLQKLIHRTSSNLYKRQKMLEAAPNDEALLAQVATLTAEVNALKQKSKDSKRVKWKTPVSTPVPPGDEAGTKVPLEAQASTAASTPPREAHASTAASTPEDVNKKDQLNPRPEKKRSLHP